MSDMTESMSEIDRRAQELVIVHLAGEAGSQQWHARFGVQPTDAVGAAVHERTAELYRELIKAAPDIWNGRAQLIADAENVMKGDDRG